MLSSITNHFFRKYDCICYTKNFLLKNLKDEMHVPSLQFSNVISLNPEEIKEFDGKTLETDKKIKIKKFKKTLNRKKLETDGENVNEKKDLSMYHPSTIKSNVALFRNFMSKLKSAKYIKEGDSVFVEGKRIIYDIVSAGIHPSHVFFSRKSDIDKLNLNPSVSLCKIPYSNLEIWSDTESSQGVVGIFKKPTSPSKKKNWESIPLTIVCDNVRDSRNMGSILRVAACVGCKKIIATKGCIDFWNPKVIRAAAGVQFLWPCVKAVNIENLKDEIPENSRIILADVVSSSSYEFEEDIEIKSFKTEIRNSLPVHPYYSVSYGEGETTIFIGGETSGLSEEVYSLAALRQGFRVFIPMSNNVNSLNNGVALGILAFEVKKQIEEASSKRSSSEV